MVFTDVSEMGHRLFWCFLERGGPCANLVKPPPLPLGRREQGSCGCVVCCLYHISRLSVSSAPSLGCMRQKYQHPENSLLCHSLGPQVRLSLPLHLLETPYFCFIYNVQGFSGRNRGSYSILSSSDQIRSVAQLCPTLCVHTHTAAAAKSLQSCPTLCDPMDSSPPGSPVPGILQARILEWVAISLSNACWERLKVGGKGDDQG